MPSGDLATLASTIIIGILAAIIKSWKTGRLRDALDSRAASKQLGDLAHEEIVDRLEDIDERTQRIDATVDRVDAAVEQVDQAVGDVGEAVVVLHADDDDVDGAALREKVGVDDMASDIKRNGSSDANGAGGGA